jgi:hypothetical protein
VEGEKRAWIIQEGEEAEGKGFILGRAEEERSCGGIFPKPTVRLTISEGRKIKGVLWERGMTWEKAGRGKGVRGKKTHIKETRQRWGWSSHTDIRNLFNQVIHSLAREFHFDAMNMKLCSLSFHQDDLDKVLIYSSGFGFPESSRILL